MKRVFADTSFLVALRDASDANHRAARDWLRDELEAGPLRLVLTDYVLAEVHAFFCRYPREALAYADRIRTDGLFDVSRARPADEEAAWGLLRRSTDKSYSFTDAVSFSVAQRLGVREAAAFDAHFRQVGRLRVLP